MSEGAGDIWLSLVNTASDRLSVSVKSPTGEMVRRIPAKNGLIMTTKLVLERSSIQIEYFYPMEGSGGQQTYIKIFDPTPGIWAVTAYGDIILNGTYHCWLPITGFVSPGVEFLTPVPYTTVVVPPRAARAGCPARRCGHRHRLHKRYLPVGGRLYANTVPVGPKPGRHTAARLSHGARIYGKQYRLGSRQ